MSKTVKMHPLVAAFRSAKGHDSEEEVRNALEEWKETCSVMGCKGLNQGIMARMVYSSLSSKLRKITKKDFPVETCLIDLIQHFDTGITEMRAPRDGALKADQRLAAFAANHPGAFEALPRLVYKDKYWNDLRVRADISTSDVEYVRNKVFGRTGEPAMKVVEKILIEGGWRVSEVDKVDSAGLPERDFAKAFDAAFDRHPELAALRIRRDSMVRRGKKTRFEREVAFLFDMYDNRSPYAGLPSERRWKLSLDHSGLLEDEVRDPVFRSACTYYEQMRKTERPPFAVKIGDKKKFRLWTKQASIDDDSSGRAPVAVLVGAEGIEADDVAETPPQPGPDLAEGQSGDKNTPVVQGHLVSPSEIPGGDDEVVSGPDPSEDEEDSGGIDPDVYLPTAEDDDEFDVSTRAFLAKLDYRKAIVLMSMRAGVNITDPDLCRFCGCGKSWTAEIQKKLLASLDLSRTGALRFQKMIPDLIPRCRELIKQRPDGAECLAWLDGLLSSTMAVQRQKEEEWQASYEKRPGSDRWR